MDKFIIDRPILLARAEKFSLQERQRENDDADSIYLTGTETRSGSCGGSPDDTD